MTSCDQHGWPTPGRRGAAYPVKVGKNLLACVERSIIKRLELVHSARECDSRLSKVRSLAGQPNHHQPTSNHNLPSGTVAMSKRSWHEANLPSPHSATGHHHSGASVSPTSYHSPALMSSPKKVRHAEEPTPIAKAPPRPNHQRSASQTNGAQNESKIPGISRKVKACAACRKQKVQDNVRALC